MVASLDMLSPAVKRRMEDIFQNDRSIFSDTRISQMLVEFPEDMAMAALNKFSCAEQDPSNVIRSRPAYLMGVLRKYRSGDRPRSNISKPRGGGGGGDSYRHDRDYSPARRGDCRTDRRDDHNSGPPPSYGYAPSIPEQQQPTYNTSQGAPPSQQQPQQQQYSSNPNYGYGGGAGGQSPNYGGGHGIQQQYSSAPQQPIPSSQQQQYPPSASQNKAETNPFGMSHRVRTRLEQMYGTGIVRREQIDARCIEFLSQMPDDLALQSLDEFSNHDSGSIRNHSAFLMSILRKNQTGANSLPSTYYSNPHDNAPHDSRQQVPSGGMRQRKSSSYGGDSPPHGRGGIYGQSSYDAPVQQLSASSGGYGGNGGGHRGSFDLSSTYPPSESTSQPLSSYSSHQQQPPPQQQQQPQYVPYDSQGGLPPTQQGGGGYPPAQQQHQPPQYGGGAPPPQQGDVPMMSNTSSYGGGSGGQQSGGSYSSMPPDQGSHHQYSPSSKGQQQMMYCDSQQPQSQYQGGSGGGSYPPPQGGGYNQQHQGIPQHMGGREEGGGEYAPTSSSSYQQSLPPSHQGYGGSPSMQHQQPPSHFVPPPGFEGISAAVVARVERLFQSGFMRREEFDDRMVDQLRGVPEDEAVSAVDEFSTCDRKKIRKIGAYFNGVLRKHISRIRERQANLRSTANRSNKRRHSRSRSRSRDRFNPDRSGGNREFERGGPRGGRDIPPRGRDRDYNDSDRMRNSRGGSLPQEKRYRGNDGRGGPPNSDFNSKKQSIPIQPPSLPSIRNVSDKVYFTLRALVAQGHINASEIDDRLGNALAQMDEGQAILALDEFGACDLDRVRNRGGYLMGLVKRYRGDGSQGSSNYPRFNTSHGPVSPRSSQDTVEQQQQQDDVALAAAKAPMFSTTPEDHSTTTAGVSTALGSAVHMEGDNSHTLTAAVPPSSTTIALEEGNAVIEDRLGAPTSYNNTPGAMPVSLPYTMDGKPAMTMNTAGSSNSSSHPPTEVCRPESVLGTATPVAYDPEAFTMDVSSPPPPAGALLVEQQPQQHQVTTTAETEMDTSKPPSFPTVPLAQDQVFGSTTAATPLEAQVQEQAKPTVVVPAETHIGEQTSGTVMTPAVVHVGEQALGTVVARVVSQQVQTQVANIGVIQAEVHIGEQTPGATTVTPVETQVPLQVASGTAFTTVDLGPGTTTAPATNAPHHSSMEAHLSSSTFVDPSTSKTGEDVVNITNSTTMSDPNTVANSASDPTEVPNITGDVGGPDATCSETQGEDTNRSVVDDGAATSSLPNSTEADPMMKVTKETAAVVTSTETLEMGEDMMERFPSPI